MGALFAIAASHAFAAETLPPNPGIDMAGFLAIAGEAAAQWETHRLSESQFIDMSRSPGSIVLDARSRDKYDELHVKGAINLPFPDIAIESLQRTLPDRHARILIYCNNNFLNSPGPFPSKQPNASLNLSTYVALYSYGYRSIYELAPSIDIHSSQLEFDSALESPLSDRPESARMPTL